MGGGEGGSDGNGRVGRILLSYILIGQGLLNVAIKGISKDERNEYYNILEKSDHSFNEIHRLIEKHQKFSPKDINNAIRVEEFESFSVMISRLLTESIDRLKGGKLTNVNKEAILPLRDLAKMYDYSQDYLRNLVNRGQLKAHKKGKLWYVRVSDLVDYINKIGE